jgi:hypothetical protein
MSSSRLRSTLKPVIFFAVLICTFYLNQWFTQPGVFEFYTLTTFPGTFLHEAAHWMTALFTDGHPSNFNLVPSGNTLGSINFQPNWYNAALVGWAPLLLMPFTLLFAALASRARPVMIPVWTYITACSWAASTPSPQDYHIAMSYPTSWVFGAVMMLVIGYSAYRIAKALVF